MERLRDQILIVMIGVYFLIVITLIASAAVFVAQLMLGAGISIFLIVPACILTGLMATVIFVALVVLVDHIHS
ncbi:MAG: hypothetical protein WCP14_00330 [bacterium]